MKSLLFSFYFIFIALFVYSENEPNNNPANASLIQPNDTLQGTLDNVDVLDWYKVTLVEDGALSFHVIGTQTLTVYTYIYDSDATLQLSSSPGYDGADKTVSYPNLSSGTYYLKISRYGGSGSYQLISTFTHAAYNNDIEPNDIVQNAQAILPNDSLTGRLGYYGNGYTDNTDWYKVTLIEDGALSFRFIGTQPLSIYSYIYDSDSTTLIATTPGYPGADKTVSYSHFSVGTYYLKIYRYDGYGSYQLVSSFTPAAYNNDLEPNDSVQNAQEISPNDSLTGRLGYYGNGYTDKIDWYKATLVEDGALSFRVIGTQSLSMLTYIFDSDSTTLIATTLGYPGGDKTVSHSNLSAGTYYYKINRYEGYGSYKLYSIFTPASYNNDLEPNDSVQNAQTIFTNDSITARLGYFGNGYTDDLDWYKVTLVEDGALSFRVIGTQSLSMITHIYDSDSTTLIVTNPGYPGGDITVSHSNLSSGIYYLKVDRYEGYGSYTLNSTFTPALYNNDIEYNDSVQYAQAILPYDSLTGRLGYYGDGYTDNFDWYKVTLVEDGALNFRVIGTQSLSMITHIYDSDSTTMIATSSGYPGGDKTVSYSPLSIGTYYLKIDRYEGYGSYAIMSQFSPFPISNFTSIHNLNTSSFTNITTYGEQYIWNFGDGNISTLVNPSHTYYIPGEYFVSLIAINSFGRDTIDHQVTIRGIQGINSNRGGNNGVASFFIYGGGLSANSTVKLTRSGFGDILPDTVTKPDVFSIKPTFNLTGAAVGLWNVVVTVPGYPAYILANSYTIEQGIEPDFNLSISGRNKILFNRWQTYTIQYNNSGNTDITGAPFFLLVSDISGLEIEFLSKTIGIPAQPNNIWWQQLIDSTEAYFTIDSIDGEPFAARVYPLFIPNIPANYSGSFTIRIKSPSDFRMITWVNDPYASGSKLNDYQTCIMWAQATALANGIVNILGNLVPGAQCVSNVSQTLYGLAYNENSLGSGLYAIANAGLSCAFDLGRNLPIIKAWELSYGIYSLINDVYSNHSAIEECERKFPKDKPTNNPINAVYSFDPNEIIGVKGYKDDHYTEDKSMYSYQIYFENLASTSAPAQEVFVYDTLDMTKFNKHNFSFGSVGFNDTMLFPIPASYEFSIDVDLRPTKDLITRISGIFDTITGIISWSFISLDPLTMDLTEDPMGGFLDPNVTYPEGVGFVSFSIGLNQNVSHGTTIENQATIVFDLNPQIMTNIWSNTLDFAPPSSSVLPLNNVINDTTFVVSWDGSDNESGILNYSIYVTKNSENPVEWISKTSLNEAWFTGEFGNTYSFYSIATDSVGNIEDIPTMADQIVLLEPSKVSIFDPISQIKVYPNPFQHKIFIDLYLNSSETIEVKLYNTLGSLVYQFKYNDLNPGKHMIEVRTDHITEGLYTMKIQGTSFNKAFKIVKTE